MLFHHQRYHHQKKIIISAKLLSEDIDLNENIEGEIEIEI